MSEEENTEGQFHDLLHSVNGYFVYYKQNDSRWNDLTYGEDPIATHACGPTSMASIISTLTETEIDPVEMSRWAYENGYYVPDQGSLHSIIPGAATAFGLNVEPIYYAEKESIKKALEEGKYVVMISGPGTFSDTSGHFIVLIDINAFGQVRISDSIKYSYTKLDWDIDEIIQEASPVSNDGGPFWAIWADEE